ncbi:NAD(P)H-binding protein [Planomonospora sp. ID91781]|uniref:NmrA family transcriptional regulator n=1 Tax=Planomonospora sphaerica TaxID=161355 RepID=A0A171CN59_9ACTN|nr:MULTISPECIES: NAD(P)H-binding protein [Planomonospora]MBG0821458.1 NAD(P)H-binding protein [Planomonospora sp. ID91781]GAT66967.1 nmrA family transcriptional regulator [Planomonospora sphaerica]
MIVVTGATGNVGRVLVEALSAAGERVTAVSRGTSPVSVPEGVRYRQADLAEPETLRPVVDGARALFLLVAGAGAHLDPGAILDVAKAGGVARLVLLSSQAAGTRPRSVSHAPLRGIEDAVRRSGAAWTILRPGGFASNAYAWAESVRTRGTVAAPFGDVGLPVVDPADIGEVAAAVLREDRHAGRIYELTGPALTTPRQRAGIIGEALGRPVRFVDQTRAEARAQMVRFMPEPVADGTLDILGDPTPEERRISPHTEQILGRPPRGFDEWARRHAHAFR